MPKESQDIEKELEKHDLYLKDDHIVAFKQGSKKHPRNWNPWSKSYTTIIVIWLEAYMTAISSAGTATSKPASKEYSIGDTTGYFAFITTYLLGQTIGAIVLAPISEVFGRRTIYIIGTVTFGVTSVIIGTPHNVGAVIVGRLFQGVAAAIPATVAFDNFDDMFNTDRRIWVVYFYTLFGMSGLAIGPIYSSYITATLGWRWVYYISAIVSGLSVILCLFIKESNEEQLLRYTVKKLRQKTGHDSLKPDVEDHESFSAKSFLQNQVVRPLHFLITEPVVTLCAVLCAIAFALLYASTEALTIIYTTPPFDDTFDDVSSSLAFIPILIGEILNILPRFYDHALLRRYRQTNRRIVPETKIYSFALACPALAIGLWILAWTVPSRVPSVPWPISMLGLICIGFAANDFSYVLFGYATDAYGPYAASAVSAVSLSRTLAAAVFPLFITQMYKGLGNNIATTVLAAVATAFCFTPWLFLKHGRTLREKSKWAAKGEDCLAEENQHLSENKEDEEKGERDSSPGGGDDVKTLTAGPSPDDSGGGVTGKDKETEVEERGSLAYHHRVTLAV